MAGAKADVKLGFWVGIGVLGAVLVWHLVSRGKGLLVEGAALSG